MDLDASEHFSTRIKAKAAGVTVYFTGEPCKNGHVCLRRTGNAACITCESIVHKNRVENNRDKISELRRLSRARNLEKIRVRSKQWRDNNKECIKSRMAKYHVDYYIKNKDKINANNTNWYRNNKKRKNVHTRNQASRRLEAEGTFCHQDVINILKEQNNRCTAPHCKKNIENCYSIDHKIPLSRRGSNWLSNIQLMCNPCNDSKGTKTMEEWINHLEKLETV